MEYSIPDTEESAERKLSEGDQIQAHISHAAGNADVTVGQNDEELIYKWTGQENRGEISFTCFSRKEE